MSRPRSNGARPDATGDAGLAAELRKLIAQAPSDRPLPTTRELGEQHGVANTTIYRVLRQMAERGEIWQNQTNGRYYPPGARELFDRPKPVACLIRRLELGSALYRELLEGISAGCGKRQRTALLWHDDLLVNHPDPHEPPAFASVLQQRAILESYLERHGDAAGGFVLDHVWSDDALRAHADRLRPAVVMYRTCTLEGFGNIRADFGGGALKALAHLLGRGFERIVPVLPFPGDPAVNEFGEALRAAAAELGCAGRLGEPLPAATARERTALLQRLQHGNVRTALVCPEDNVAVLLATQARDLGLQCPDRLGVLSVMGTDFATKAGLSCVRYDFRELGRRAVEALAPEGPAQHILEAQFSGGSTT